MELKQIEKEEERVQKEMRLQNKRRLERVWQEKRLHHQRIRWSREWILERAVCPAIREGNEKVQTTVSSLVDDILGKVVEEVERRFEHRLGRENQMQIEENVCKENIHHRETFHDRNS